MFYMNHKLIITLLIFFTPLILSCEEAKKLFKEAKCMSCHNTGDFQAKEKKVNNFKKLHKSVEACAFGNNVGWFDEEVEDVSKYLNNKYYHFKDPLPKED
ncbi:hypothetical protein [Sulfurimonas sp.]